MIKPGKLNCLMTALIDNDDEIIRKQAQKDAHDIATHYINTRCVNSNKESMGAAVYCYAYDALLAGGSKWAVRMNCEPIVTRMELDNAAPVPAVKRKPRVKG